MANVESSSIYSSEGNELLYPVVGAQRRSVQFATHIHHSLSKNLFARDMCSLLHNSTNDIVTYKQNQPKKLLEALSFPDGFQTQYDPLTSMKLPHHIGASMAKEVPARNQGLTYERILDQSLYLFNEYGEQKTSMSFISGLLKISPGNLYYHFKNKDVIVEALYLRFERLVRASLGRLHTNTIERECFWKFITSTFDAMWQYRFLYRDTSNLISKNRFIEVEYRKLSLLQENAISRLCKAWRAGGVIEATDSECVGLVRNIHLVLSNWLSFEQCFSLHCRLLEKDFDSIASRGSRQVYAVLYPYLIGPESHGDHRGHYLSL